MKYNRPNNRNFATKIQNLNLALGHLAASHYHIILWLKIKPLVSMLHILQWFRRYLLFLSIPQLLFGVFPSHSTFYSPPSLDQLEVCLSYSHSYPLTCCPHFWAIATQFATCFVSPDEAFPSCSNLDSCSNLVFASDSSLSNFLTC